MEAFPVPLSLTKLLELLSLILDIDNLELFLVCPALASTCCETFLSSTVLSVWVVGCRSYICGALIESFLRLVMVLKLCLRGEWREECELRWVLVPLNDLFIFFLL